MWPSKTSRLIATGSRLALQPAMMRLAALRGRMFDRDGRVDLAVPSKAPSIAPTHQGTVARAAAARVESASVYLALRLQHRRTTPHAEALGEVAAAVTAALVCLSLRLKPSMGNSTYAFWWTPQS
mmetsp:Transcript_25996/g.78173  ORF Transcript_25996/g.78173 Transcript_25996/m.78173 type:complete len:125 (+) Transcript_25996:591-965(+)